MAPRVLIAVLVCAAACRGDSAPSMRDSQLSAAVPAATGTWSSSLTDSLLRFGEEDQTGRDALVKAVEAQDTAVLFASLRADSVRSRWLKDKLARFGWPPTVAGSDSAAQAAWLILQHSPDTAWQAGMLPELERLASTGALPPDDVAMLADRVMVKRGAPQRYATQFTLLDGKLVPEPIGDTTGLDARRAAVGLPPMTDYVRRMQEQFKVPVVWPPLR